MGGALTAATALGTVLAAILGILKYFNYRTKRDQQAIVGQAFAEVVRGLGAVEPSQRIASAVLLRRFFDPKSEYAVRGLPYAADAVRVMAGVLRQEPTGTVQKALADGLAFAPSLAGGDLQRTNLREAYLSLGDRALDVSGCDFYGADLSYASFRNANARQAVFFNGRLVGAVLKGADLSEANFVGADLLHARFDNATLDRASFADAINLPAGIEEHLDAGRVYRGPAPFREPDSTPEAPVKVFLSAPSVTTADQRGLIELVVGAMQAAGLTVDRLARDDYQAASPLAAVRQVMAQCSGLVVVGLPQLIVTNGRWRDGTPEEKAVDGLQLSTPWNQIEAGMAAALGLPIFVVRSNCAGDGIFSVPGAGRDVTQFDLCEPWNLGSLAEAARTWTSDLPRRRHGA